MATLESRVREAGTKSWRFRRSVLGSEWTSMETSFGRVLPQQPPGQMDVYVCEIREDKEKRGGGGLIGIEFGGPGYPFVTGLPEGVMKKSIGITLVERDKRVFEAEDRALFETKNGFAINHEVVLGDITRVETYKQLEEWLNGEKADVIFERLLSGFDMNPQNFPLAVALFSKWYEMLAEGGVLFVQVPRWAEYQVQRWYDKMQRRYGKSIWRTKPQKIQIAYERDDNYKLPGHECVLRLRKMPGAPEKLPFVREV